MDESATTISALLQEFGTRLNELEEKQRLLKDRILLIGNNLISTKEEYEKKDFELRKKLSDIDTELKSIKQFNKRVIYEMENFARKEEFTILERQFRMFQPIEFARIKDIKRIVYQELLELQKNPPVNTKKDKDIKNKEN